MSPTPPGSITKDEEKSRVNHSEDEASRRNTDLQATIDAYSPQEIKRLTRRIDLRLVVVLGLLYGVNLMDRTNLPNAAISGYVLPQRAILQYRYV